MKRLLGIDLGTSSLKAAVCDLNGNILGLGRVANRYLPGPPGWAEQDPSLWWLACCQAVRAALSQAGCASSDVVAVGVCGFHHCPVFLDAGGAPVRPTIVTHDIRLGASLEDLRQTGVLQDIVRTSGSWVVTGHFPPIYHLVRTQDPQALEQTRWIVLAKDYLRYRLTGHIGTEICDATGTHLIAMPQQEWSPLLCELLGVPSHQLPEIGQPAQVAGHLTREAAEATGLAAGTPVVYGGGDSHCALLGLGVVASGQAGLLLGTNSTLRASFDLLPRPLDQIVWIQQHVAPGHFTVSASSMAGSSVLSWFGDLASQDRRDSTALYREIDSLASRAPPGAEGLIFHPYLFGERSPFYDPQAKGSLLGISHRHGRAHILRSIMEGVACAVANCLDAIQAIAQQAGQPVTVLRTGLSGGGQFATWRQILADALNHVIEVVDSQEPGCLGAALLAGVAVGIYASIPSAARQTSRTATIILPDPHVAALYSRQRVRFNESYQALSSVLGPWTAESAGDGPHQPP